MASIGGLNSVSWDGVIIPVGDDAESNLEGVERPGEVGLTGDGGYTEKSVVTHFECVVLSKDSFDISQTDGTDKPLQFECKNGKVGQLNHAWRAKVDPVNLGEGKYKVRWECLPKNARWL